MLFRGTGFHFWFACRALSFLKANKQNDEISVGDISPRFMSDSTNKPGLILLIEIHHIISEGIHPPKILSCPLWIKLDIRGRLEERDRNGCLFMINLGEAELKRFGSFSCAGIRAPYEHISKVKHCRRSCPSSQDQWRSAGSGVCAQWATNSPSVYSHICWSSPRVPNVAPSMMGMISVDVMINVPAPRYRVRLMLPAIPSMPNLSSLQ